MRNFKENLVVAILKKLFFLNTSKGPCNIYHQGEHSAHLGRFVAHLTSAVSRNAPLNRGYFQNKWLRKN
jgi:hypothetical protein